MYASTDSGVAAIERQIRLNKTRLEKRLRDGVWERDAVPAYVPAETEESEEEFNLVMATRGAMIKKTALDEFRNLRKNGLIAIALREGDELIGVRLSTGDDEMLLSSRKGKCIRFNERHVRNLGRNSIGVRSMRLDEDDEVIDIAVIEPDTTILAITTNGFGKRTDPEEYREQGRGGKGIRAMNLTDKTGDLAALLFVHEEEDILLITDD
jgi:DNA gyrase subunit A